MFTLLVLFNFGFFRKLKNFDELSHMKNTTNSSSSPHPTPWAQPHTPPMGSAPHPNPWAQPHTQPMGKLGLKL